MMEESIHNFTRNWYDNVEQQRLPTLSALQRIFFSINAYANITKPIEIVEMGCGHGFTYRELLPISWQKKYKGFDLNQNALNEFVLKSPEAEGKVFRADAYKVPLADKSVNLWFGLSSYDSVRDLKHALMQATRCLRPNGLFYHIQDIGPCPTFFKSTEFFNISLAAAAKQAGLSILKMEKTEVSVESYRRPCHKLPNVLYLSDDGYFNVLNVPEDLSKMPNLSTGENKIAECCKAYILIAQKDSNMS